jgi:hypothetical protein
VILGRSALVIAGVAGLAVLIGLVAWTELAHAASLSTGSDMDAYWNAALRLRDGAPLYQPGIATDSDLYRYAPWFAYAWVPLTYLPKDAVLVGWMALCLAAAVAAVAPLLRHGPVGWAALAFLLPFGLEGAAYGNVQPLLVLGLLWGVPRRTGPIWVALAASLKLVPIVLVAVYAGRREWARAAWTLAITAALVLPALAFDLSGYPRDIGAGQLSLLTVSPLLFWVVAAVAVASAYRWAGTRWAWLLGSLAMMLALPRFLLYEISFATVGLAEDVPADGVAAVTTPS